MISVNDFLIDFKYSKSSLDNLKKALLKYNNPQNNFKVINVVGTNGKGSTANFISEGLKIKFKKVGLFTSPAFLFHNERFKINNNFISDVDLKKYIDKYKDDFEKYSLNFFEIFTFICAVYFSDNNVDIAVIEAGIGGCKDSTTIFENQIATCVTSISYDHTEILGKNIKNIINQKISISKNNSPIFISYDNLKYIRYINKKFKNIILADKEINEIKYQEGNLGLAKSLLKHLQIDYVENNNYLGRFTILRNNPLIIIDGCHNKDGIIKSIESLTKYNDNFKILYASSKNERFKYIKYFKKISKDVYFCEFEHYKSWKLGSKKKKKKNFVADWKQFIEKNIEQKLYICGSLYFIPEVYKYCKILLERG